MVSEPRTAPPWTENYPPSVPRQPFVPEITLPRMLDEAVARFPQSVALSFEGNDLTYLQLRAAVDRLAMALSRLEVNPGDRIAFVAPNCPQLVTGLYAAMRIGAVAVPLNPHADVEELRADLITTGAEVVLCTSQAYDRVAEARVGTSVRTVVVTRLSDALSAPRRVRLAMGLERSRRRRELRGDVKKLADRTVWLSDILTTAGAFPPAVDTSPAAAAVILFTAGGSGDPRPITLSHRSLVASAYQTAWWLPNARAGRETTLGLLPLFQVLGLTMALNATILLGGRLVLVPGFDPAAIIEVIEKKAVTYFPVIPAVVRSLLERRELRTYRTPSLRETFAAGSSLPNETAVAFERMTGSVVATGYGTTETGGLTHAIPFPGRPAADVREAGLVGVPLPLTDMKVVDFSSAQRAVAAGVPGELLVRGPQIRDIELDADGFFHTGDIVTADGEGRTRFICRAEDVIRVGRQRVWPGAVEGPVLALPEVARAAAVQGYRATGAAVVKLVVEIRSGSHLDSGMIRDVCERELPAGSVPAQIEIRESLPLTGTGEVLRRALRDDVPARKAASQQTANKAKDIS